MTVKLNSGFPEGDIEVTYNQWADQFSQVTLSGKPELETLVVSQDQQELIKGQDYSYDEANQRITFTSQPPAAALIEAFYVQIDETPLQYPIDIPEQAWPSVVAIDRDSGEELEVSLSPGFVTFLQQDISI